MAEANTFENPPGPKKGFTNGSTTKFSSLARWAKVVPL